MPVVRSSSNQIQKSNILMTSMLSCFLSQQQLTNLIFLEIILTYNWNSKQACTLYKYVIFKQELLDFNFPFAEHKPK